MYKRQAKGMVLWAKENAKASGLEDRPIRWIVDDCAKFVEREIRRGKTYDAIIMDPPSYGRGPSGEVWKLEENLYPFVEPVSYTHLTSVVWCGYNDPEEIVLTDSETNPAIVMWKKVMERVHQNLKNKAFKQPANLVEVTVCRDSGLLPSDACALDPRGERTVRVTLSAHDVPTETCNVHKEVERCV